jgi:iron-sulfur cluster assembly accessory protein
MARPIEFVTHKVSAPIALTERAAARIAELRATEPEPAAQKFRVSVLGGGCSGFQYRFTFDRTQNADDLAIEQSGVTVLIDPVSAGYMGGAVIDYVTELMGSAFRVDNPQAESSCGCGTSFSIG